MKSSEKIILKAEDLDDVFLAVAATNNREVNRKVGISLICGRNRILKI